MIMIHTTSANMGIFLTNQIARIDGYHVSIDSWRWVMVMGGLPIVLGAVVFFVVPESPKWLTSRTSKPKDEEQDSTPEVTAWEVFKPGLLGITLVGILLATVPLLGGWGSANWAMKWADQVGAAIGDNGLKADVGMARSLTGIVGSLLGGWVASVAGRRSSYFVASVVALGSAQYRTETADQILRARPTNSFVLSIDVHLHQLFYGEPSHLSVIERHVFGQVVNVEPFRLCCIVTGP